MSATRTPPEHSLPDDLREALEKCVDPYGRTAADLDSEIVADYDELFDLLREIHELVPDLRFGQLIVNLSLLAGIDAPGDPYNVPDPHLIRAARAHLNTLRRRAPTTAPANAA